MNGKRGDPKSDDVKCFFCFLFFCGRQETRDFFSVECMPTSQILNMRDLVYLGES